MQCHEQSLPVRTDETLIIIPVLCEYGDLQGDKGIVYFLVGDLYFAGRM
jgi:hypothetical protein